MASRSLAFEEGLDEYGIYRPESALGAGLGVGIGVEALGMEAGELRGDSEGLLGLDDAEDVDDQDFNVDEQGIWCDTHAQEPLSHMIGRADSGLGMADRKSSSSTLQEDNVPCGNQAFHQQQNRGGLVRDLSYLLEHTDPNQNTQPDVVNNIPQQSLSDFEQLEAVIQTTDMSDDHIDLIGAYLRDLEEQESEEQGGTPWGGSEAGYTETPPQTETFNYYLNTHNSNPEIIDQHRRSGNSLYNHNSYEDNSLLTNQKAPFDINVDKSGVLEDEYLDHNYNYRESLNETHDSQVSRGSRPKSASRIPMLRSRSPSMSIPGSTSNSYSSVGQPCKSSKSPERSRRKLPATPAKSSMSSSGTNSGQATPRSSNPANAQQDLEMAAYELSSRSIKINGDVDSSQHYNYQNDQAYRRPQSRSGRPQPKVRLKPRPASAEGSRQNAQMPVATNNNQAQSFKIRTNEGSASTAPGSFTKRQPVKANHALLDIRNSGLQQEEEYDKAGHSTVRQLQKEYNTLLQKYAQAENTIDTLRIGAKVPVHVELTATGSNAGTSVLGSLAGSARSSVPGSVLGNNAGGAMSGLSRHNSVTSMASSQLQQQIMPHHSASQVGSRPNSRQSITEPLRGEPSSPKAANVPVGVLGTQKDVGDCNSGGLCAGSEVGAPAGLMDQQYEVLIPDLGSESIKLSLMAKTKAVQDQADAFRILLDENHLTLEDQKTALANIKNGYECIQADYREACSQHDRQRRRGSIAGSAVDDKGVIVTGGQFDHKQELQGELHRLNMQLDDMEHRVGENIAAHNSARMPFQNSPMKEDNSIDPTLVSPQRTRAQSLSMMSDAFLESNNGHKPPSSLDEKLKQVDNGYTSLMEQYQRLKEIRHTPERDKDINTLIKNLRDMYDAAPADQKPFLPPEILSTDPPVSNPPGINSQPNGGNRRYIQGRDFPVLHDTAIHTDTLPGTCSDQDTGRAHTTQLMSGPIYHHNSRRLRSGSVDSIPRTLLSPKPTANESFSDHENHIGHKRHDTVDKDSGYLGSEVSRRTAASHGSLLTAKIGHSRSARKLQLDTESPSSTDNESYCSTVDRALACKPKPYVHDQMNSKLKLKNKNVSDILPSQPTVALHSKRSDQKHRQSHHTSHSSECTDSMDGVHERSAVPSGLQDKTKQIRNLEREVSMLKDQLKFVNIGSSGLGMQAGASSSAWQTVATSATGAPPPPQQVMCSYPVVSANTMRQQPSCPHITASGNPSTVPQTQPAPDFPYYQSLGMKDASNIPNALHQPGLQGVEDYRAHANTMGITMMPTYGLQQGRSISQGHIDSVDFTYPPHPNLNLLPHHPHSAQNLYGSHSHGLHERYFAPIEPHSGGYYSGTGVGYSGQDPPYNSSAYLSNSHGSLAEPWHYDDFHFASQGERHMKYPVYVADHDGIRNHEKYYEPDDYPYASGYYSDGEGMRQGDGRRCTRHRSSITRHNDYNPPATEHLYQRQYKHRSQLRGHNHGDQQPYSPFAANNVPPSGIQRPAAINGRLSGSMSALPTVGSSTMCCPMCDGTGVHRHGSYVYPPPSANSNIVNAGNTVGGSPAASNVSSFGGVNNHPVTVSAPAMVIPSQTTNMPQLATPPAQPVVFGSAANVSTVPQQPITPPQQPVLLTQNATMPSVPSVSTAIPNAAATTSNVVMAVPCVPVSTSSTPKKKSKVRYYIREYGGESESDREKSKKSMRSTSHFVHMTKNSLEDSGTESDMQNELDDELNDSLRMAMRTAKKLYNISYVMKNSLQDELMQNSI